jgi:hypothetical protein
MEYNTKFVHNPTEEVIVGRWDSVDYPIAPGETKAFPTFLCDHFSKHNEELVVTEELPVAAPTAAVEVEEEVVAEVVEKKKPGRKKKEVEVVE